MDTLITDRAHAETGNANQGTVTLGAVGDENEPSQPMPRFAAAVRMFVKAYIVAIFALVLLRGIDTFLHS